MRYLVTGGWGFIGSNLVRHLLAEDNDATVVNIDAGKYGSNPANLEGVDRDRYSFVSGDITDAKLMIRVVADADRIVNLAAETHVDRSISDSSPFLASNTNGVVTVLEALRKAGTDARIVHVSTDEVYGDIEEGSFTEESGLRPSSPYAASKAAGDMFVLAYARTYGLEAMLTRCTNNYGSYQFPEKLIPKTIIRASMGKRIPVYGTGENVRDWIHVADHCSAINAVLEGGRRGGIYNAAGGEERTNIEVVRTILRLVGRGDELIEFVEDRPGHDVRYSLDASHLKAELGWRPRHDFAGGLEETVEWYLKSEPWWRPLVDDRVLHPTPWKLAW